MLCFTTILLLIGEFTHHCESSGAVIKWVHQTGNHCVVDLWPCINGQGEVGGGGSILFTERKTLFNKGNHVLWIINCCGIYFQKSIFSLRKTVERYSSSNRHCMVCRPLYYPCSCTDRKISTRADRQHTHTHTQKQTNK